MSQAIQVPEIAPVSPPVTTAADAQDLATHYAEVMDGLLAVVEQETALVRAGKLGDAARLAPAKTDYSRLYIADTLRLRASQNFLAQAIPETLRQLTQRHDAFRTALQTNLTVLATAHAVSEGIVRGVSDELTRKTSPQTYGSSGRANAPDLRAATPLAVSRTL